MRSAAINWGLVIWAGIAACGLGLALAAGALWLAPASGVIQVAGLSGGLLIAIAAGSVVAIGAISRVRLRSARTLDGALAALGLQARPYLFTGRQLHGSVDGRRTDALLGRDGRVDLWVEVNTATRADFGAPGAPLPSGSPLTVTGLEARALDPEWARRLLEDDDALALVTRLCRGGAEPRGRRLLVEPDALHLALDTPHAGLVESARDDHTDLCHLARIIEALPATEQPTQSTWIETAHRTDPSKLVRLAVGITTLLVGGTTLLAIMIAVFAVVSA